MGDRDEKFHAALSWLDDCDMPTAVLASRAGVSRTTLNRLLEKQLQLRADAIRPATRDALVRVHEKWRAHAAKFWAAKR